MWTVWNQRDAQCAIFNKINITYSVHSIRKPKYLAHVSVISYHNISSRLSHFRLELLEIDPHIIIP